LVHFVFWSLLAIFLSFLCCGMSLLCERFLPSKNFSVFSNTRSAFFTKLKMIMLIQLIGLDDKTVCINAGSLCSVLLEYDIWKLQPNHGGLKLSSTNQHLFCADDFNLLCRNIHTVKKNTEVFQSLVRRMV
jgi:hypothetical protein